MASIYVYPPTSGTANSHWRPSLLNCPADPSGCGNTSPIYNASSDYCGSCCHPSVYCSGPIDIGSSPSRVLDFWADPAVQSIYVTPTYGNVCAASVGSPWDDGIAIDMYSGTGQSGTHIGTLFYAHVQYPFSGGVNTINGGVTYLGYTPSSGCSCSCYQGAHVHVEHCGNSVYNPSVYCAQYLQEGSSGPWLFRYDY